MSNSEFAKTLQAYSKQQHGGVILFLTDASTQTWQLPVPDVQIEYFHVEKGQVPTMVPQILLASCGYVTWQAPIQQYVCDMHQRHVPIIIFPYSNSTGTMNDCKLMNHVHALQGGKQESVKGNFTNEDTTIVRTLPHHPLLYQVQTFQCNSMGRIAADPMPDTTVVATWCDGVPLIAERDLIISLNFCPYNVSTSTDAMKMIRNSVLYLLGKNMRHLNVQRIRAFLDVKFVF